MNKFEETWKVVRATKDCAIYDRGVKAMLESASTAAQHNAATVLSFSGKTPEMIRRIDEIVGIKDEG